MFIINFWFQSFFSHTVRQLQSRAMPIVSWQDSLSTQEMTTCLKWSAKPSLLSYAIRRISIQELKPLASPMSSNFASLNGIRLTMWLPTDVCYVFWKDSSTSSTVAWEWEDTIQCAAIILKVQRTYNQQNKYRYPGVWWNWKWAMLLQLFRCIWYFWLFVGFLIHCIIPSPCHIHGLKSLK